MKTNADIADLPRSGFGAPDVCVSALSGATMKGDGHVGHVYLRAFEAKMSGDELRLIINGEIGVEVKSADIEKAVHEAQGVKRIRTFVNTIGGNVLEGMKIRRVLIRAESEGAEIIHVVDTLNASAGTVITCCGTVLTHSDSQWLYHNPALDTSGEASDLREMADELDKIKDQVLNIYCARNPTMSRDEISDLMNSTTVYTGDQAVTMGWADGLIDGPASGAVMNLAKLKPAQMKNQSKVVLAKLKAMKAARAVMEGDDEDAEKAAAEAAAAKAKAKMADEDKAPDMSAMMASMADAVEALGDQVAAIADAIEQITGAVETIAEETEVDIGAEVVDADTAAAVEGGDVVVEEPAADMKSPQVIAMSKLAKVTGREEEFTLMVEAGASVAVLRASFVNGSVSRSGGGSSAANPSGLKGKAAPKMASPSSIFAARKAAKKA